MSGDGPLPGPTLVVPPPATRMETLKALAARQHDHDLVAVLVPTLGPDANTEFRTVLQDSFSLAHQWDSSFSLRVYEQDLVAQTEHGAGAIHLPHATRGWSLWTKGAGATKPSLKRRAAQQLDPLGDIELGSKRRRVLVAPHSEHGIKRRSESTRGSEGEVVKCLRKV